MHQDYNSCLSILKTFLVENYSFRLEIRYFQFSILIAAMQYYLRQIVNKICFPDVYYICYAYWVKGMSTGTPSQNNCHIKGT